MIVAYCSDLHLDTLSPFHTTYGSVHSYGIYCKADVLILAGDFAEYSNYKKFDSVIFDLSMYYKHVIMVPGNHEYYFNDIDNIQVDLPHNFHILNNESIEINGHTFYGGCGWSDLSNLNEVDRKIISYGISDFNLIRKGSKTFTTEHCTLLYNDFYEKLVELDYKAEKPYTVISHFPPSKLSVHPRFEGSNLNDYFTNDLDKFIETSKIDNWICGHVHHIHEYEIGKTKVRCNPRGYSLERFTNGDKSIYMPRIFNV